MNEEKVFIAHKKETDVQTLKSHLEQVAAYAEADLKGIGLGKTGHLIGLLHDMGKYTNAFQDYIVNGGVKGSVIHTFQGCRYLLDKFHGEGPDEFKDVTAELLASAVGAHHGLFDLFGDSDEGGFTHRIIASDDYEEAVSNFQHEIAAPEKIQKYFDEVNRELEPIYEKITEIASQDPEETLALSFYFSQLFRVLLSAVIDGDRTDTAEYMTGEVYSMCESVPWANLLLNMERKLDAFDGSTEINRARRKISDICKEQSTRDGNLFRLNVPTGGSKTLSSLRFALNRCAVLGKKRIIFTAPLISILEQNSKVIHDFIGDDSLILDHYSNAVQVEDGGDSLNEKELLAENWDAPVIITSLVQLLNTLFAGKTTSIRRYQALCNSVVVIDEVQTVPNNMLSLFNLAVNFLTTICGTTFVLCSATQPCFEDKRVEHPMLKEQIDIVAYDKNIWDVFKRTEIIPKGDMNLDEVAGFATNILNNKDNILIICNKKNEAETLFDSLKNMGIETFHLSSADCMAHRRDILDEVREHLSTKRKVALVSTQVIEAGVDISFECVIRLQAGMDSVVQAAGRCNRNGELSEIAEVYLINFPAEKLFHLEEIKRAKNATNKLLYDWSHDKLGENVELTSDLAIKHYYRCLYAGMDSGFQNFTIKELELSLFDLLSVNSKYAVGDEKHVEQYFMRQAFATAGKLFKVFDNDTTDVIVPYGDGRELITELCSIDEHNISGMKNWLTKAKPYMVSLYDYQIKDLEQSGLLYTQNGVLILKEGVYGATGITSGKQETVVWEV